MTENAIARMTRLARTFPCMRRKSGVMEDLTWWNAETVDAWAASGGASHGERITAQFLLAVWNPDGDWESGKFDLMEALPLWDDGHREAFLTWAKAPWWA